MKEQKKSGLNISEKISSWSEGETDKPKQKDSKTQYQKYIKKYSLLYQKLNVYRAIYKKFKEIVHSRHNLTLNDATNLILLDFLEKQDPGKILDHLRKQYLDLLQDIACNAKIEAEENKS